MPRAIQPPARAGSPSNRSRIASQTAARAARVVVAGGRATLVRAGPQVAALGVAADEPRGGSQPLEVGGIERGFAVGGGEAREGFGPRALGVGRAGAGEGVGLGSA